jgi:hypothetical protein
MNYTQVGLDLQAFVKRVYYSILYQSTFYKFLNENYIGEIRQTGAPMIEVIKSNPVTVNVREGAEIATRLDPTLTTYTPTKVDLTELPMDYSLRVPMLLTGSNIINVVEDAADQKDSAIAKQIDTYGFKKLKEDVFYSFQWAPSDLQGYINALNQLKANLFNKDVVDGYRLGLSATEYASLVSALTSILKYESMAGVEGVDRGEIARAYGVDIFPINDNYINPSVDGHSETVKGYFFNSIAVVGDSFFDGFNLWNGNYPGYPNYFVLEGNQMFGAEVVRPEAIIKLTSEKLSA